MRELKNLSTVVAYEHADRPFPMTKQFQALDCNTQCPSHTQKEIHKNIYCSIIDNREKLEEIINVWPGTVAPTWNPSTLGG